MLRGASMLPEVVSLPPTSLKAVRQFFLKLATQGIQYYQCILRIELEKAQNAQGKVYGKAVLKFVRKLSAGRDRPRGRGARVRGRASRSRSRLARAAE